MSVRRQENGLRADSYVRLVDCNRALAETLLPALAKRGIAAYTTAAGDRFGVPSDLSRTEVRESVHVDAARRPAARRVLEETMPDAAVGLPTVEEEEAFAALVAGWDEPSPVAVPPTDTGAGTAVGDGSDLSATDARGDADGTDVEGADAETADAQTVDAQRAGAGTADPEADDPALPEPSGSTEPPEAEGGSGGAPDAPVVLAKPTPTWKPKPTAEGTPGGGPDADPLAEDDHFVRPTLPPGPPAHPVTKWGLVGLLFGVLLLIFPTLIGLEHSTAVDFVGVLCILGSVGVLVSRLSSRSTDEYEGPDDGAVV